MEWGNLFDVHTFVPDDQGKGRISDCRKNTGISFLMDKQIEKGLDQILNWYKT